MPEEINYDEEIKELLAALIPYGYQDMQATVNILHEFDISYDDFGDFVDQWCNDTGTQFMKDATVVDLCALAHEMILDKVRNIIRDETETDIVDDLKDNINVFGNYMDSSFDNTNSTKEFIDSHKELLSYEFIKRFREHIE